VSGYVLSPRAQQDLDEIWQYTVETRGVDQAEDYTRLIQRAIEIIAADPRKGRSCEDLRAGYRKYPAGSHLLFYRTVKGGIDVVRSLHVGWILSDTCKRRNR
jgi:toxin ParE1/3/4